MADLIEQRSEEWLKLRLGIPTASRLGELMARTKSGYGASRDNLMAELLVERLTGQQAERFVSAPMQWGIAHEDEAVAAYEFHTGLATEKIAFVRHPELDSGASPDVLVGDDGLAEFKCPNSATHIETLLGAEIPNKYDLQMQWQMACTNRRWCDFVSYDPRMPENLRLHIRRVKRDDAKITSIQDEVKKFLAELNKKLEQLKGLS